MAANLNGVTYYKLDANAHGYMGDITKNSGLRGEEIDGNFHFLRGHDIESISLNENGVLEIKRYNGEILFAKQTETHDYDFKYDSENGFLIITKPNGEEIKLVGFKSIINIYHDETIEGDGTEINPLKISDNFKDGIFSKIEENTFNINKNRVYSDNNTVIVGQPTEEGTNISVNIDDKTIVSDEDGKLSVNPDAFIIYEGENSISVSNDVNGVRTVSLNIHKNDDILLNDENGLFADLRLQRVYPYNNDNGKDELQLVGKNNTVISRIDIADFIKDGILENVYLDNNDKDNPLLVFKFNTDSEKEYINVPIKELVDIYEAGNGLELSDNKFHLKIDKTSDDYLSVSNEGIRLSGLKKTIDGFSSQLQNLIREQVDINSNIQKIEENKVYSDNNTVIVGQPTEEGTNISVNIDDKTIVSDEDGKLSVNPDAFISYEGENSISVSNDVNGVRTVSLNIHKNDDILLNDENGLFADLRLQRVYPYNNDNGKDELQLVGKDNIVISRIDIADFINNEIIVQIQSLSSELQKIKNELKSIKSNMITGIKGTDNEISVNIIDNVATVGFANDTYFIAG